MGTREARRIVGELAAITKRARLQLVWGPDMISRIWKITKKVAASGLAVAALEGTHVVGSENETVLQPQEIAQLPRAARASETLHAADVQPDSVQQPRLFLRQAHSVILSIIARMLSRASAPSRAERSEERPGGRACALATAL